MLELKVRMKMRLSRLFIGEYISLAFCPYFSLAYADEILFRSSTVSTGSESST